MTYTQDREEFIAKVTKEGLPVHVIRTLLAKANTLQRIAELSCSSEAADRDRVPCPGMKREDDCICDGNHEHAQSDKHAGCKYCGQVMNTTRICHQDVPRIDVQEARIKRQLVKMIEDANVRRFNEDPNADADFKLNFQGDPRGAVVKLAVPSGAYDDMGREGLCVPSKGLPASFWDNHR